MKRTIFCILLLSGLALSTQKLAMAQIACSYSLGSGIYNKWLQTGGEGGFLGCPIMSEAEAGRSPRCTTGRYVEFSGGDGGYIVWHGSGRYAGTSFEVHGCIFKLYKSAGGSTSWLGFPVSDEYDVSGGRRSDFEGGYVLWNAQTGACQGYRYAGSGGGIQELNGTWKWDLICSSKFPNGNGQMQITVGPDGKFTGTFTSQWGEVRSGTMTDGVQQNDEITFNFIPNGWTSYLIWKGSRVIRDGSGLRIEGQTFYYGGQDCCFTMYRDSGTGNTGGGICDNPRTLAIMDEWLARAIPPQKPGESLRYEAWGRLVGKSLTANNTVSGPPETRLTRCEWLWQYASQLRSTNLGTLKEYVEQRR